MYIVKLRASTGAQSDCLFVVRARARAPLLVEIPTATYEAYNAWGGDSLYPGGRRRWGSRAPSQGVEVSYDRPYDSQTGAGQFFIREVAIVRFLERYGYPVGYTTIESIDRDPAQAAGRAGADRRGPLRVLVRGRRARVRRRARTRHEPDVPQLRHDGLARALRARERGLEPGGARDHRIIAYKQFAARDPDRARADGAVPPRRRAARRAAPTTAASRRAWPWPGRPSTATTPGAPRPACSRAWLFAGTGVTAATRIPGIVGYELDQRTPATPPGTALVGDGTGVPCMAETRALAGPRNAWPRRTLYTARSGALVFATGTLGWLYALSPVPQASPDVPRAPDPRVVAMTRNLLARVLGAAARAAVWRHSGASARRYLGASA